MSILTEDEVAELVRVNTKTDYIVTDFPEENIHNEEVATDFINVKGLASDIEAAVSERIAERVRAAQDKFLLFAQSGEISWEVWGLCERILTLIAARE